jgi:hypothetical protein
MESETNFNMESNTTTISNTVNGHTSWGTVTHNMYGTPELIDVIVTPSEVQLVYKKQSLITTGLTMPQPEVYKVVYSRQDGSEKIIAGHYIPANKESYEFD